MIGMLEATIEGIQKLTDLPLLERWSPADLIRFYFCIPAGITNRNLRALMEMQHNVAKICDELLARDNEGGYARAIWEIKIAAVSNRGLCHGLHAARVGYHSVGHYDTFYTLLKT